ncbi:MAG: hypothetical protein QUT30_08195 [Acidobacteriota bacterium]|jgi:hypothetical protein|nr:hypothetical protein [Acidobacteriota bacterium]
MTGDQMTATPAVENAEVASSADIVFAGDSEQDAVEPVVEESATSEHESEPQGETEVESESETDEGDESESQEDMDDEEAGEDGGDGAKPESRAERRIKQLTARLREAEARNAKPDVDKEPQADDYETVEEYIDAKAEWKARQKELLQRQQQQQAEWQRREARAKKAHPDFNAKELIDELNPTGPMEAFLGYHEFGPEVLHYMATHPQEVDKFRDKHWIDQIDAMSAIARRIANNLKGIKQKPTGKPPRTVAAGSTAGPAKHVSAADLLYG